MHDIIITVGFHGHFRKDWEESMFIIEYGSILYIIIFIMIVVCIGLCTCCIKVVSLPSENIFVSCTWWIYEHIQTTRYKFVGTRYIKWKGYTVCIFTNKIISMEYLYFLLVDLLLQFIIPVSIWL